MKLYGLLIGIDNYSVSKLNQCVNDISKIESYLKTLDDKFETINLKKLTDEKATKENIISQIQNFLSQASDEDVALVYYSGHGAQEASSGRFKDEHTGLIDCLVSYDGDKESGFLLADKELRYVFSKFTNNPHLITIFDCCHSGDMVRNFIETEESDVKARRLSGAFPPRNYKEFIFSEEISEIDLKGKNLSALIPFKNGVHIAACLSTESSWEDAQGGVFTRYLIQLLEAKDSKLSYQNITKWAKISLRDITSKKQTPLISVQGDGKMDHFTPWLNLYPKDELNCSGKLVYNSSNGWYYTKGQLEGVKIGMEITVKQDNDTTFKTRISEVNLEDSLVEDPLDNGISLDYNKSYPVTTFTLYTDVHVCINNFDFDDGAGELVNSLANSFDNIKVTTRENADFAINIFNQTVYLSLPQDEFRPLAVQINLLQEPEANIVSALKIQLTGLTKWHHYNTLDNIDSGFAETPIKVEIRIDEDTDWKDVTSTELELTTKEERTYDGEFYQQYQMRVTNISKETLYVTCLLLAPDMSISADPYDNLTKQLKPKDNVLFFQHLELPTAGWSLDKYKEVYNWEFDWMNIKFIVNNFEDLSTSIGEMLQNALPNPLLINNLKGYGPITGFKPWKKTWDFITTILKLKNPNFNIISGDLLRNWEGYTTHDIIAPFINKLYFNTIQRGLVYETENKPNATEDQELNSKNILGIKKTLGNFLDDKIRLRKFRKFRSKNPNSPIVVGEGDSWFLYPFLVKDTLDYVMEKYALRSLAAAGDELENYKKDGQLLEEISRLQPRYVLISGGGNDIIGPAIVDILKNGMPGGLTAKEYLNEKFEKKMEDLDALYHYFFNEIAKFESVKHVFVHGYDYVLPEHEEKIIKNGWVNRYLMEKGVKTVSDRKLVINYLIDTFNDILHKVTLQHKITTYLDVRNLVGKNEWFDEIHPNDKGFAKVGGKFIDAINQKETVEP